ncbi:MAG: hypothetical protein QHH00_05885 [Methanomassiliicoccales archaeon]|jgi:hypothetical protein|nr:hypothetical protein [Methanomassiliicoccales archaeon]
MGQEKPCCPESAARKVKKLNVGGFQVGIAHLDEIIEEVKNLGLRDSGEIGKQLLKRAKIYNYIPPGAEGEYAEALLKEYLKRR